MANLGSAICASGFVPSSEKVGGSGKQFTFRSLSPRLAKKFFFEPAGFSAESPWNRTDLG